MSHPSHSAAKPSTGVGSGSMHGHTSASAQAAQHHHQANNNPGNSTRYLCALFGLIRYESTGAAGPGVTPAPVLAVAKLCTILRAMCHSDGQRLLQGRQAQPLLDTLTPITNVSTTSGSRLGLVSFNTPSSVNLASTPLPPQPPQTPNSPFIHTPTTTPQVKTPYTNVATPSGGSTATTGGAPSFLTLPTFHQSSLTLIEATTQTMTQPNHTQLPQPQTQLAQDTAYLTERERRLHPIVSIIAAPTPWSLLVPQRFSRYVRVYRSTTNTGAGGTSPLADMQAWREIELPSTAPVAPHHVSSFGASHEQWRVTHMGKTLLPTKTLCHVRPIRVTPVSSNYTVLLEQNPTVAYERDYEFIQEGFRFEDRDGIEVLVYQILKVPTPSVVSSASVIRANRWLCEVRSICLEDSLTQQQVKVQGYAKAMEQQVRWTKFTPEGSNA